ncbi:helix-turn-helix domain-containing protein [Azospirillum thermophilum]|uniref:AraC family transcriptional regulator n=1 Tax=Azospirillum thermophilum TaxID=2202148 RepID=A0A2S2CZI7_9PROT|nr:helix-turn-helix domain-containing protein [Azospirillum thermophilum]AWK89923.1 AraC family transcriptional regulator [Azospirillum thermophilum]
MTSLAATVAEPIPRYWLYGEPPTAREMNFVHVETIRDRMRLHNWEVRPHRHDGLCHALLVREKGGGLTADGVDRAFRGPALIIVPAQVVHGFRFEPEVEGLVLTMSEGFLSTLLAAAEPELRAAVALPRVLNPERSGPEWLLLEQAFAAILREFRAGGVGRASAIAAQVTLVLVAAARLAAAGAEAALPPSPDVALLARLRQLIEERYRDHWPVEAYARALGVTAGRLNAACRRVTGCSTLQLVHARLMLEARRTLVYTGLGMSEIGYALGFEDPAYFSRFFTKREGCSPLAFRLAHPRMEDSIAGNGLDRAGEGSPQ